ncbi:phospholipase [Streptomyces sp. NPDC008001]|uniref:phospholipase n=1 Tax=Streptomyces sp. NPDC008001 TaxID=3364804 RepID=UPI0036E1D6B1
MTTIAALGAVLLVGAAAEPALAKPSPKPPLQTYTDKLLFTYSMKQFQSVRDDAGHTAKLDWSSDGCSWAPDRPMGFNFLPSCQRHDFGYRNYKKQGRFGHDTRLAIDNNFKADLYTYCRTLAKTKTGSCEYWARVYYGKVREHGGP